MGGEQEMCGLQKAHSDNFHLGKYSIVISWYYIGPKLLHYPLATTNDDVVSFNATTDH